MARPKTARCHPDAADPHQLGWSGKRAVGEVKISPEGEILTGGLLFMGYLNQPKDAEDHRRQGWLHTGDVGDDNEVSSRSPTG